MSRLLPLLLALTLLAQPLLAAEAKPKVLPETVTHGDSAPSHPAEAARRIEAGKVLLDRGDLEGAQREFEAAERAESADPMSYFYRAVIAYRRGDYPAALRMAEYGCQVADENVYRADKPVDEALTATAQRLKELHDTIKAKADATPGAGNAVALLRTADEAYANGLLAKAAAAYAEAFRADPTRGEIGLKAATLFADRLKNPLEAARLWQQVLAAGEPHATTARAELQSHRDTLDSVLQAGLAKRDQWRSRLDPAEPLRLAEAFPESTELQIELALLFARKGPVEATSKHLQAASRLGLSADDFLARKEFVDHLQQTGGMETATGQAFASFVRDAYGEETLTTLRTELKRRSDEIAQLAREKAEKERQAKIAKELRELNTWRQAERMKAVQEVNALLGSRNNTEVPTAKVNPSKYDSKNRFSHTRANYFSYENGQYVLRSDDTIRLFHSNGVITPSSTTETSTFTSAASFAELTSRPSNWVDVTTETTVQPAAGFRQLCQLLNLAFRNGVVLRRMVWRDYNGNVTSNLDMPGLTAIDVHAMTTDQDISRLRQLFLRLAQLDQAGDNVEKLRQLR